MSVLLAVVLLASGIGAPAVVRRGIVRGRIRGWTWGALRGPASERAMDSDWSGNESRTTSSASVLGLRLTLTTVAASVRSGSPPARAWQQVGVRCGAGAVPLVEHLRLLALGDLGHPSNRGPRLRPRRQASPAVQDLAMQQALAIAGACAVVAQLGAPLADVLEEVGASIAEHREAFDERRAALAGPRASAQVLAWLPVVTLAGSVVLGASPWSTATDGGLGTLAMALGGLMLLAGRRWTAELVARAEYAAAWQPGAAR